VRRFLVELNVTLGGPVRWALVLTGVGSERAEFECKLTGHGLCLTIPTNSHLLSPEVAGCSD
jgi:hypothetical protein